MQNDMSIQDLVLSIKRNGLLQSMHLLERIYQFAIESEQKLSESEARCVKLAAENVALKQAAEFATASDMWIEQADGMLDYRYHEWYVDVLKTAMETPATDRIVAGIKADGVDMFIDLISGTSGMLYAESVKSTAADLSQLLREGAK